jgi:SAM-dependent methyltransferase
MIRYGDKDFDEAYLGWGFQNVEEQMAVGKNILNIIRKKDMSILDLGCGIGTYHKAWLDEQHAVTGVDFSETFIFLASNANPGATYLCENYYDIDCVNKYDLVTMLDIPLEDDDIARIAYNALKPGGSFVFQAQNPLHQHSRGLPNQNNRSWKENEDHTFLLTRNEYNDEIDRWEYEEWHIDIEKGEIEVEHTFSRNLSYARIVDILLSVGFATVTFLDGNGRASYTCRDAMPSYFCRAYKGEY